MLTEIFSLDHENEFLPSFSLQFISVACKMQREGEKKQKTQHASERERTKKKQSKQERARERTTSERKNDFQPPRAPIRPTSERTNAFSQPNRDRSSNPELRSGQRARERTISSNQTAIDLPHTGHADTDLPHTGHAELCQTTTAPNAADPR